MEDTHFIDREPNKYEALMELQKEAVQSMNEQQIDSITEKFEICWDLQTQDFRNARELGYRQFIHGDFSDPNKIDILAIKQIRERQRQFLITLKNRAKDLGILTKPLTCNFGYEVEYKPLTAEATRKLEQLSGLSVADNSPPSFKKPEAWGYVVLIHLVTTCVIAAVVIGVVVATGYRPSFSRKTGIEFQRLQAGLL